MKKILFLGSPNAGVGVWREQLPALMLKQAGHAVEVYQPDEHTGPETYLRECAVRVDQFQPDIIWTGRLNRTTLALFRRFQGIRVFDLDDHAENVPDYNPAAPLSKDLTYNASKLLDSTLELADVLTTSTQFLAGFYGRWKGTGAAAVVCPNAINTEIVRPNLACVEARDEDPKLRVCLSYTANRHGDMGPLLPLLHSLANEGVIRLTTMGSFPKTFWRLSPRDVRWAKFTDVETYWRNLAIAAPDVVISRLEPNEFNLAKSNIKWQEATAVGAVLLGSRWGELADNTHGAILIPHGDAEIEEWEDTLRSLALDKAERSRVELNSRHEAALSSLQQSYTTASPIAASGWLEVLNVESSDRPGQWIVGARPGQLRQPEEANRPGGGA